MKADISRKTFDAKKSYSGVRMQQGRVQVDADWNEQVDIQLHRQRTARGDVIGPAGVPRPMGEAPAAAVDFQLSIGEDGTYLEMEPGRIYVGGLLCELYAEQGSKVVVDPFGFSVGAQDGGEGEVVVDDGTILIEEGDYVPKVLPGYYLLYLDVWEREVHAAEDPELVDPALLVPDTSTRSKIEWTVRAAPFHEGFEVLPQPDDCHVVLEEVARTAGQTPRLSASTDPAESQNDPCTVPASAGYRGIENQLYRVEVHRGSVDADGVEQEPTFKWSRENGAVVFEAEVDDVDTAVVHLRDLGRDDNFGLETGDLVEVVSTKRAAAGEPAGPIAKVGRDADKGPTAFRLDVLEDPAGDEDALLSAILGAAQDGRDLGRFYLRRWDHRSAETLSGDGAIPIEHGDTIALERGILVEFHQTESEEPVYRSGDYWLIPARAANDRRESGEILWPGDDHRPGQTPALAPEGVQHHLAPLGFVSVFGDGGQKYGLVEGPASDCRESFPPLTDIRADEVSYDESGSCFGLYGVTNVQEALDQLCRDADDLCEFVIRPDIDWRAALEAYREQIGDQPDLHLCVKPGTYALDEPLAFEGFRSVTIRGSGPGARFDAGDKRTAMLFESCEHVDVSDITVTAGLEEVQWEDSNGEERGEQARGAISALRCDEVSFARLRVRCAGHWRDRTSCLCVQFGADREPEATARLSVADCKLEVGHRQTGLRVLEAGRLFVERNTIVAHNADSAADFEALASAPQNPDDDGYLQIRDEFIDRLFADVRAESPRDDAALHQRVFYKREEVSVWIVSDPELDKSSMADPDGWRAWHELINEEAPAQVHSPRALLEYLNARARDIIYDGEIPETAHSSAWEDWRANVENLIEESAYGLNGVLIAGQGGDHVVVRDNAITGCVEGVHVGLSLKKKDGLKVQDTRVEDNHVDVFVPYGYNRERHGVFVGNFHRVDVSGNRLTVERARDDFPRAVDGIRIYGVPGYQMLVKDNYTAGFAPGIHTVFKDPDAQESGVWSVIDNYARCQLTRIEELDSGALGEVVEDRVERARNRFD